MDRIFSGVQPTGNLHIGNYLGAIKNFVSLQNNDKKLFSYYCVVDLHAITVWQDPKKLRKEILETTAIFLAAGLDPKKSIIFNQSKVECHAELSWILNCICRIGWLNRMTQFKEKAGKNKENVSLGLYSYPVLMAADILSYKSNLVPVGEDQKQHLELARDIAKKFNHDFEVNFFPEVKPLIFGNATRVMSLRDAKKKMSKSDISDYSRINLLDRSDDINNKIKKAKTDSLEIMGTEALDENGKFKSTVIADRPEAVNLIEIFSALSGLEIKKTIDSFSGKNFKVFKEKLADIVIENITPVGNEVRALLKDESYLTDILEKGAQEARVEARKNLKEIKQIIGFI